MATMRRGAVLPWVLTALASCVATSRSVDLSSTAPELGAKDYGRAVKLWTRDGHITKDYDTAADLHATYLSWQYRIARAATLADRYRLTQERERAAFQREFTEWRNVHEFHVAVATSKINWNDFSKANSIWRFSMEDDRGRRVEPIDVRRDKSPVEEINLLYPQAPLFAEHYVVRFPKVWTDGSPFVPDDAAHLSLRLDGPLGSAQLVWETVHSRGK
jgi:hypothetical protein